MGLFLFPFIWKYVYLFMITREQLIQYTKYSLDPIYAIENLFRIRDMNDDVIPLVLTINQKNLLNGIANYRFNVAKKNRFLGSDTALAAWIAVRFAFQYDPDRPETILYCSSSIDNANEFIWRVKFFLNQIPDWAWPEKPNNILKRDNKNELQVYNGCRLKGSSNSRDAIRGFGIDHLIMDNAANFDYGREIFGASMTSLGTGGKATVVSEPNGFDEFFETMYSEAEKMISQFNNINMHWAYDPRFNKEMTWTKDGYTVPEYEYTQKSISHKLAFEWNPTSDWSTKMAREYDYRYSNHQRNIFPHMLGYGRR